MTEQQIGFDTVAREQVLDRVLEHASDEWREQALRGIARLAATGQDFQAADLVDVGVPEPDHANRWGGVFYAASKAGLIEHAGYAPSTRPTVQGSAVKTWRGKDAQPTADRVVDIRAVSVHRPYAALIIAGVKTVENRGWAPRYRGTLVIHAAKARRALSPDERRLVPEDRFPLLAAALGDVTPSGFVGAVELTRICISSFSGNDCDCGPWAIPGQAHWQLANPRMLPRPIPANGRQGLFIPPLAVADMARRASTAPEGIAS